MLSVHAILVVFQAVVAAATPEPPADDPTPACCQPGDARTAAILAAAAQATKDAKRADADLEPEVLAVLDAIDRQTLALADFASNVRMDSYDDLADETERRFGRVYLRMPGSGGKPSRAAAVVFERNLASSVHVKSFRKGFFDYFFNFFERSGCFTPRFCLFDRLRGLKLKSFL